MLVICNVIIMQVLNSQLKKRLLPSNMIFFPSFFLVSFVIRVLYSASEFLFVHSAAFVDLLLALIFFHHFHYP